MHVQIYFLFDYLAFVCYNWYLKELVEEFDEIIGFERRVVGFNIESGCDGHGCFFGQLCLFEEEDRGDPAQGVGVVTMECVKVFVFENGGSSFGFEIDFLLFEELL